MKYVPPKSPALMDMQDKAKRYRELRYKGSLDDVEQIDLQILNLELGRQELLDNIRTEAMRK